MLLPADPGASYLEHKDVLDQVWREVMQSGWYILGPRVENFEKRFAGYLGVGHCVGVASGTDAVHLALRALGIGGGDAVITVSHTAVATVAAVDCAGASAILVDIDPATYTIDPQRVEDTLLRFSAMRIRAIVAVHLYGHPADMDALAMIAERHGVYLVEDCAQAHGASVRERRVGAIGVCAAFSFYPTKNLGAYGDGGACVTSDASVAERLRLLRQYGWRRRYISDEIGYNSRLDELQAAILDCKLAWLDDWNERRRQIAHLYDEGLAGLPLQLPVEKPGCRHVFHQYVIRLADRDGLSRHLEAHGIRAAILYPVPVHLQPAYRGRVTIGEGGMTLTERVAQEILCLPIYPELSDSAVAHVVGAVRAYFG